MKKVVQHITLVLDRNMDLNMGLNYLFGLCRIFEKTAQVIVSKSFPSSDNQDLEGEIRDQLDMFDRENPVYCSVITIDRLSDLHTSVGCLIADTYLFVLALDKPWRSFSQERRDFLKTVKRLRVPVFLLNRFSSPELNLNYGLMPLDHKKESREKIMWTCAFGKHAKSFIHVVVPNEKDDDLRMKMNNTLFICKKTMRDIHVEFEVKRLSGRVFRSNQIAIDHDWDEQPSFCVLTLSRFMNIFHKWFGIPEEQFLFNKKGIPILLIVPREDLYVPCV